MVGLISPTIATILAAEQLWLCLETGRHRIRKPRTSQPQKPKLPRIALSHRVCKLMTTVHRVTPVAAHHDQKIRCLELAAVQLQNLTSILVRSRVRSRFLKS